MPVRRAIAGLFTFCFLLAAATSSPGDGGPPSVFCGRATLHVRPSATKVMRDADPDEKGPFPMAEEYAHVQAAILRGERVRLTAMRDAEWAKLKRGDSDEAQLKFMHSVRVTQDGTLLYIDFSDSDPAAARTGAGALVRAFLASRREDEQSVEGERAKVLDAARTSAQNEYDVAEARVAELSSLSGVDNLEKRYEAQGRLIERYSTEIDEIDKILVMSSTQPSAFPQPRRDQPASFIDWPGVTPMRHSCSTSVAKSKATSGNCAPKGLATKIR